MRKSVPYFSLLGIHQFTGLVYIKGANQGESFRQQLHNHTF
jgi:hypothetical protein